ncbi:MAG: ferritin-like domain-containing protein [Verrucomicrobia bacterium]|nr:ferritin-like domain-containing protein [Verrucomicrobiota bacterium]
MKLSSLYDLLLHELKDLYSAEKQLTKALPKLAKAATNEQLRGAFEEHLEETEGHLQRLEEIAEQLEARLDGHTCKAMQGLVEEGQDLLEEDAEPAVRDAALIGAAQRVEHYEIAGYGTARTLASLLGHEEIAELLDTTLEEEKATDEKLTALAEAAVNAEAAEADGTEPMPAEGGGSGRKSSSGGAKKSGGAAKKSGGKSGGRK